MALLSEMLWEKNIHKQSHKLFTSLKKQRKYRQLSANTDVDVLNILDILIG